MSCYHYLHDFTRHRITGKFEEGRQTTEVAWEFWINPSVVPNFGEYFKEGKCVAGVKDRILFAVRGTQSAVVLSP